jgi:ribulose-phosphate 3-epimerase
MTDLHLDMMDGHFVANLSFGPYLVQCLRAHVPDVHFACHLMTSEPEKWIDGLSKVGGDVTFTFHYEATEPRGKTQELINSIRAHGMKVGMTVSPDTPVDAILAYADQLDLALIMTVYPGKGGQSFISEMMSKIKVIREKYPLMNIEVDGGVKPETIMAAAEAGANMIVSGSGVYKAKDMAYNISFMQRAVEKYGNGMEDHQLSPMRSDADEE